MSGDGGYLFAQELCQAPLYFNPYLLRSGHYCTHRVTQNPQGPVQTAGRGLQGPVSLRQAKSSAPITEQEKA